MLDDVLIELMGNALALFSDRRNFGPAGLVALLGSGALLGAASTALYASPLIEDAGLAWFAGLLAPFVVGAAAAGFRKVKLWDWQLRFDLNRFGTAFCVMTGFVLARGIGVLFLGKS
ncbi:hypothetical protein [Myxococcus sp. Y35]|uniref:hypothetical protein n=1 Tax=Pseudomyxococcus flavus TaxID=3115648 RepID=UPI003CF22809